MSVQVTFEPTPNPATMKFHLHRQVTAEGFDCANSQEAERSPLAAKIFGFPWTSSVYVGPDFITVTKQDWVDWELLANPLTGLIQEHLDRDEPVVVEFIEMAEDDENDSPMVRNIKSVLNREIRPVVALDGGDIVFHKYQDQVLYVHMKGACSGCPSSSVTLKEGIETRMRELFPEIKEVVAV
ncbi:NifU family protein [Bdellovibrio reynosensis]|uniref:NifU family protein n=1 Tax=Bdellovibrio reynosensis TaxID=2835041 RepID=A0ABY4C9T9_9BACT|nr:NifU family protein [Bdellovibrio reynosensis]UOF01731.1 NifU family protein [Bdellovibrio reynosensis]